MPIRNKGKGLEIQCKRGRTHIEYEGWCHKGHNHCPWCITNDTEGVFYLDISVLFLCFLI